MNQAIYREKSRIQKGTKIEHYMQTIRFNQNNEEAFVTQTEQQNNSHGSAENEMEHKKKMQTCQAHSGLTWKSTTQLSFVSPPSAHL